MTNVIDNPPERVPAHLVAGDTLKVSSLALGNSFPSGDGWSVLWIFAPIKGGVPVEVAASYASNAWDMIVADDATALWSAGRWNWVIRTVKDGQTITADKGFVDVSASPTASNTDQRSHAERTLDLIEATIEGRASKADLEHQFEDGRRIKYMTHAELLAMRDSYAARVAAEHRKARGLGPSRLLARL